jgi:hypothetical protein
MVMIGGALWRSHGQRYPNRIYDQLKRQAVRVLERRTQTLFCRAQLGRGGLRET